MRIIQYQLKSTVIHSHFCENIFPVLKSESRYSLINGKTSLIYLCGIQLHKLFLSFHCDKVDYYRHGCNENVEVVNLKTPLTVIFSCKKSFQSHFKKQSHFKNHFHINGVVYTRNPRVNCWFHHENEPPRVLPGP